MDKLSNQQRISRGKKSQDFRFLAKKKWIDPFINKNVLDLGCGNGVYTKYVTELGIKPTALDINHDSLKLAREYVGQPKLKICQASGLNLPFDDAMFDLVICIETISHIPHEKQSLAFKEISRVIKNDGMLITSVHNSARFALQHIGRLKKPVSVYKNPGLTIYPFTKKELIPIEDRGAYLIIGSTDEGSSFEYTQDKAQIIESRLLKLLEAEDSPYERLIMRVPGFGKSATTYNSFIIIALLDEWKNRKKGSQTVLREAIGKIVTVPQAFAFPISPQSIRVSNYNKPVQMVIYGTSYEELEKIQNEVIQTLRKNRNLSRIESDYTKNKPEVKLITNKNRAKDLGVSTETIGRTLETFYGGKRVTSFNRMGREYPIILQQYLADRRNKDGISKIHVRSETSGKLVSLASLVEFEEKGTAETLPRYNRQRAVTISAAIDENYSLAEAMNYLENTMNNLAPQNQITWKGKSEELKETSNEIFIIFALALITAYLVMAATFNSFIHPFIIILTVPLAVFGGLIFILFLNSSINIFSQIALVILIGISTKNSILIVDYANQIRRTGAKIETAIKDACKLRIRPIIMTSLSTMIAMLPLVIGNIGPGAGEGSRLAVGSTILGGMIISTFFTLYITPTMYLALAKNTKRIDAVDIELKKQLN